MKYICLVRVGMGENVFIKIVLAFDSSGGVHSSDIFGKLHMLATLEQLFISGGFEFSDEG